MFAYRITAIDWGWNNLKDIKETLHSIIDIYHGEFENGYYHGYCLPDAVKELVKFSIHWEKAQDLARDVGWDGDFRNPPKVFWLPNGYEFYHAFVFSQSNDGLAFVVSPFELPWLERDDVIV